MIARWINIMPALARLPAPTGIAAMQSINITAVRAAFMTELFGTALICLVLGIHAVRAWGQPSVLGPAAGRVGLLRAGPDPPLTRHALINH